LSESIKEQYAKFEYHELFDRTDIDTAGEDSKRVLTEYFQIIEGINKSQKDKLYIYAKCLGIAISEVKKMRSEDLFYALLSNKEYAERYSKDNSTQSEIEF